MPRKSLILYASLTGNTEKVALRFQKVFIENIKVESEGKQVLGQIGFVMISYKGQSPKYVKPEMRTKQKQVPGRKKQPARRPPRPKGVPLGI